MFDIKREDAFLQAVNYLLKNDEEQLTIHDLITKMGQLCKNLFSFKPMKRWLLDYVGESYIYWNEEEAIIITLRSISSNIFQKCHSLPKPEGHEIQKLRVI